MGGEWRSEDLAECTLREKIVTLINNLANKRDLHESNEHPILFSAPMVNAILDGNKTQTRRVAKLNAAGRVEKGGRNWHVEDASAITACPYGYVGDRLWVRETHYVWKAGNIDGSGRYVAYRATDPDSPCTWTPSIHMPRWASRITLDVTGISMERLQAISEYDCEREGVGHAMPHSAKERYAELWDKINGKRHPWKSNPWVWVVTFQSAKPGVE